jgi:hypothetical protein
MKRYDKTSYYFNPSEEGNTGYALHSFGMLSRRNYLELTGFAAESFVVDSTPLRLNVQIRLPEKVEQPRTANYNWNGRFWRMQSTVAASRASSALLQLHQME